MDKQPPASPPGWRNGLHLWSEGDARTGRHAGACVDCRGNMSDRCHGITRHQNGERRPNAETTEALKVRRGSAT
jgi:hypothetical protein